VSDLLELRIATNKKHISCDSVWEHLLACNSIIAKCQKDPTHISLNLDIVDQSQRVKQVHDTLFNQNVDWLLAECKMNQRQSWKLFDLDVSVLVHTKVHNYVNDTIADKLVEKRLMVSQQGDCKDCVGANRGRKLAFNEANDKLQKLQTHDLLDHVGVKANQSGHPT
jgi:hypothetical protein